MGFCVTDFGYLGGEGIRFAATRTAATIKQVTAVAQFSLNAYDAVKNYQKLASVSSRGIAIEESQFAHVRDTYWPYENQFLTEFTTPTVWEDQAVLAKRYTGRMWAPMANVFAKRLKELECNKPRYCSTAYKRGLQELLVAKGTARANVESLADRIAFYEVEQIRETDFARRQQAITLRKNLIMQAGELMQSAAQGLAGAGADSLRGMSAALQAFSQFAEQGRYAERGMERERQRQNQTPTYEGSPYADMGTTQETATQNTRAYAEAAYFNQDSMSDPIAGSSATGNNEINNAYPVNWSEGMSFNDPAFTPYGPAADQTSAGTMDMGAPN